MILDVDDHEKKKKKHQTAHCRNTFQANPSIETQRKDEKCYIKRTRLRGRTYNSEIVVCQRKERTACSRLGSVHVAGHTFPRVFCERQRPTRSTAGKVIKIKGGKKNIAQLDAQGSRAKRGDCRTLLPRCIPKPVAGCVAVLHSSLPRPRQQQQQKQPLRIPACGRKRTLTAAIFYDCCRCFASRVRRPIRTATNKT